MDLGSLSNSNSKQIEQQLLHEELHRQRLVNRSRIIKSFTAKAERRRSQTERLADRVAVTFGSIPFLVFHLVWFGLWLLLNINLIPGLKPFDPFPFGLLTMIVSLEAIVLSIFVLISQNRAARTADLREEISMQVGVITEEEITKLMELMVLLLKKNNIDLSKDLVLMRMLKPTDVNRIEKTLEKQMKR